MSDNIVTSPEETKTTTGTKSSDDLLSHGICMVSADDVYINNNHGNCKINSINSSALNGDGDFEDGQSIITTTTTTIKSMDNDDKVERTVERSVEMASSSSSASNSSSSSSSSTGSSSSSTSSTSSSTPTPTPTPPTTEITSKSQQSSPNINSNNNINPNQKSAWACKICNFTHKWPLIMINHLRIFHKLQSPFDQYLFKLGNGLAESSSSSTPSSTAKSPNELVTYQPTSTNIKCKLCDTAFETNQDLEEHNEHLHSDMVWACKSCSFSNKWQQLAISHLRSAHHCHPPYTDHLYRKNSDKTSSLLQRIQSVSLNFRSHLYPSPSQHQDQQPPPPTPQQQSKPVTTSLLLSSTSASPAVQENANNDQLINANLTNNINDNNGNLDTESSKLTAEKITSPPSPGLQLPIELKLATKDCYRRLDNDRFECMKCGKTCGSAQGITEHYEAYHLGLNYQCKVCSFTDLWRSMLTKHLKVKHNLGKPYEQYLRRVQIKTNSNSVTPNRRRNRRNRTSLMLRTTKATTLVLDNEPIYIVEPEESGEEPEVEKEEESDEEREEEEEEGDEEEEDEEGDEEEDEDEDEDEEDEDEPSAKKVRSSSSTFVPTSSRRSSNNQQLQVKTTGKRGRKPKDKSAIKVKTVQSKRRRSKKTLSL